MNRCCRLLFVYDCLYPDSTGGVEHRNRELARELAARGHAVTLAGWSADAVAGPPGVRTLRLPFRSRIHGSHGRRTVGAALRWAVAVSRIDVRRFDLVETANIPYLHLGPLSLRCRMAGRPLLVSWYEYWERYWTSYLGAGGGVARAVERWSARLGTAATAVSELTARRVARARGGDSPRVVPAGVRVDAVREAARGSPEGPPLVYAGRLHREKRVDLLLAAVARLAAHQSRPLLTIAGSGPDESRLRRLVDELGLGASVRFAGRLPDSEDVWRQLGAARIAVQTSEREGFGMFPLEAMACGLPVVYCRSPESAVGELVRDGVEGLCVEPDPVALSEGLRRLLVDEGLRARMARAARGRAAEFEWGRVAAEFDRVVGEVLAAAEDTARRQPRRGFEG